jgi:hypothetical protein
MKFPMETVKGTPLENVAFRFVQVTPALATEWLAVNTKNRRVKAETVDGYARDMKAGEWLTTHQGVAFNEADELIDGQHRLLAIQKSGSAVLLLVSSGWPKKMPKQKSFTMDAVDRGCLRSLPDQLELQHGIANARSIVQVTGALAAAVCGLERIRKQTPAGVLAIVEAYREEFKWLAENVTTTAGLRSVHASSVIMLGLAAWPEPTKAFYEQLKLGLNLTANSPVYHLRNFLMSLRGGNNYEQKAQIKNATAHHLRLFVEGKTSGSLVTHSNAALLKLVELNATRAKKLVEMFKAADDQKLSAPRPEKISEEVPEVKGKFFETPPQPNTKAKPNSPEAIKVGNSLTGAFSLLDLTARCDGGNAQAGHWLSVWRASGWIEPAGFGQYQRTAKFPKAEKVN